ncbi:3'-5' exonuclease [Kitasatospora sp. NPDC058397]|uniref:3'-5' exonuclease n=1 Tax=unclassified Kitasatospora TaxID=2633591 RepID=UPI003660155F
MTSATDQTKPTKTHEGAPVFEPGTAPEHLLTANQLGDQGRRVLKGQKPAAWLDMWMPRRGRDYVALYDPADSIAKRPSAAQQQAKTQRRTCGACVQAFPHPLPLQRIDTLGHPARWCGPCRDADRNLYRRTCRRCATVWEQLDSTGHGGTCAACSEHLDRARAVARALEERACPRCTVQTATAEEVAAAKAADFYAWWNPRACEPCTAARQAEREEAERHAYRERWPEVEAVRAWARELLADPATAIMDTETTGLHYEARIVEIAAYTAAGEKLLDTLLDPGEPIPPDATEIHGITDADVAGFPTFGEVLPELTRVLAGRRIVIYNRSFDRDRLRHELDRWHRENTPLHPPLISSRWHDHPAVEEWIDAQRWEECAMEQYAQFVGEWNDYYGSYRWQRLNGGHRAGGDCLAVADRLREIAAAPDPA